PSCRAEFKAVSRTAGRPGKSRSRYRATKAHVGSASRLRPVDQVAYTGPFHGNGFLDLWFGDWWPERTNEPDAYGTGVRFPFGRLEAVAYDIEFQPVFLSLGL